MFRSIPQMIEIDQTYAAKAWLKGTCLHPTRILYHDLYDELNL